MSLFQYLVTFSQVHYYLVYVLLFLGSYLETVVGMGFFVRGEVFFLVGAILAGAGDLNIWIVSAVCIVGGLLGDSTSYFIGKRWGHSAAIRIFRKENRYLSLKLYKRARNFFHKHGRKSIFLGRFGGPISCITPFLAGISHYSYKTFLEYDIPATIIGIGQFLVVGYLFGFSYYLFLPKVKKYIFYAFVLILGVVLYFILRKSKFLKKIDFGLFKKIFNDG